VRKQNAAEGRTWYHAIIADAFNDDTGSDPLGLTLSLSDAPRVSDPEGQTPTSARASGLAGETPRG